MPGLFGIETPEEVRARIGRTGREQDLGLAQLPAGRGAVALASRQGRLIGQGAGQVLGVQTAPQKRQQKNKLIQDSINATASQMGITKEKNPTEYLGLSAQILAENGETQAATNAMKFAGQMDNLINSDQTALERNIRQIFGLSKRESIQKHKKAGPLMQRILTLQSTPSSTGIIPSDRPVTTGDRKKSRLDVSSFITAKNPIEVDGEKFTSSDDFVSPKNRQAFELAHARRMKELTNLNKGRGKKALSESAISARAFEELQDYLNSESNKVPGTGVEIPFTQNLRFDEEKFNSDLLLKEALGEVSESAGGAIQSIGDRE